LNIKVTDNNNEVFFKIKRTTALSKLMNAFCERQGKSMQSVRFLFDGARVNPTDSPDSVSHQIFVSLPLHFKCSLRASHASIQLGANTTLPQLEMADGDTLEVHQEQIGGSA
jgi:small ubiquitin-related modifier